MSTLINLTYFKLVSGSLSYSTDNEATYASIASDVVSAWAVENSNSPELPAIQLFWQASNGLYYRADAPSYSALLSDSWSYEFAENGGVEIAIEGNPLTTSGSGGSGFVDTIPVLSTYDMMGNQIVNTAPATANGEVVVYEQLTALQSSVTTQVQALTEAIGAKIDAATASQIAADLIASGNYQNDVQVNTAIQQAIAGLDLGSDTVLSVPVKRVFNGVLSSVVTTDLVPGDGNLEGLAQSGILVISPTAGETGIYYLNGSGTLTSHNASLISDGMNIGSWVWAETAEGGTLAYRVSDITPVTFRAVPTAESYNEVATNGVHVDPLTRNIYLAIDESQFAFDGQRRLVLASAIAAQIALIPTLATDVTDLKTVTQSIISQQVAQQSAISSLANRMADVELLNQIQSGTLTAQGNLISQQGATIESLDTRVDTLESTVVTNNQVKSDLVFNVINGIPSLLDGSPATFVSQAGNSTASRGYYNITHDRGWHPVLSAYVLDRGGKPSQALVANNWAESETVQSIALPKSGSFRVVIKGEVI
jgi:hypothetical protein